MTVTALIVFSEVLDHHPIAHLNVERQDNKCLKVEIMGLINCMVGVVNLKPHRLFSTLDPERYRERERDRVREREIEREREVKRAPCHLVAMTTIHG